MECTHILPSGNSVPILCYLKIQKVCTLHLHDDHTQPVTAYFPKCHMLVKQQRTVEILLLAVVPWFVSVVPITAHLK